MVEKLAAQRLPAEFSLAPDAPQVAFRQLRQEWVDCGFAVAPQDAATVGRARSNGGGSGGSNGSGCGGSAQAAKLSAR